MSEDGDASSHRSNSDRAERARASRVDIISSETIDVMSGLLLRWLRQGAIRWTKERAEACATSTSFGRSKQMSLHLRLASIFFQKEKKRNVHALSDSPFPPLPELLF